MCGLGVAHTPFREKETVMSGLGLPALPSVTRGPVGAGWVLLPLPSGRGLG